MKKLLLAISLFFVAAPAYSASAIYLRSTDGDNADDGLTWATAKATLANAIRQVDPGGVLYVSQVHAESTAGNATFTSSGTVGNPVYVLSVNDSAEPPTTLTETSSVTTTGTTSAMTFDGGFYFYGIKFSFGTGNSTSDMNFNDGALWRSVFEKCILTTPSTNAGALINAGVTANPPRSELVLINSTISFANVSQNIQARTKIRWYGGYLGGTVFPTVLFTAPADNASDILIRGVDLSNMGSGKSLVSVAGDKPFVNFNAVNCKLGASVSLLSATENLNSLARIINSDSSDTNYRYQKSDSYGTITNETTIVRAGGATDKTTPISFEMVTTAQAHYSGRLESDLMSFWNESVGSSITISIPIVTDNVTLTNKEAWLEVDCLGTNGFPMSVTQSNLPDVLTTGTNNPTDASSSWVTTGLTTPVKQTLSATCQPFEKGMIDVRVVLAKPSTTLYFDPKALPSSGRQFMTNGYIYLNEAMQSGGGFGVGQ